MDREELKQTLYDQFEPLEVAVQKKLEYLQGDDVFSIDNYAEYSDGALSEDDSLTNAFNTTISPQSAPMYQNQVQETMREIQSTSQPRYAAEQPTADSIASHKQNIAAKIAALRGISMPGDYISGIK